MKNLLLLLFLVSCATYVPQPEVPSPLPVEVETEIVLAPTVVNYTTVTVASLTGFNPAQAERFRKVAANTQTLINEVEFKQAVESHSFKGKNAFHDTQDTPKQVYEKITSQGWQLEYRLERLFSGSTVGYTLPSVSWIVLNSKFIGKLSDAELAANICHEYAGHKLGRYNHSQKYNSDRPYSVPYALGTIVEKLYQKHFPTM